MTLITILCVAFAITGTALILYVAWAFDIRFKGWKK
jgi:hypothetical protein